MNGWDWNEIQMNMLCIRWGIQEFAWVMSFAFTLQIVVDIAIRGRELRMRRLGQIKRHWKFAIATVVVLLLSWIFLPNVKAETIIERDAVHGFDPQRERDLQTEPGFDFNAPAAD